MAIYWLDVFCLNFDLFMPNFVSARYGTFWTEHSLRSGFIIHKEVCFIVMLHLLQWQNIKYYNSFVSYNAGQGVEPEQVAMVAHWPMALPDVSFQNPALSSCNNSRLHKRLDRSLSTCGMLVIIWGGGCTCGKVFWRGRAWITVSLSLPLPRKERLGEATRPWRCVWG